jgi:hypothetical protein
LSLSPSWSVTFRSFDGNVALRISHSPHACCMFWREWEEPWRISDTVLRQWAELLRAGRPRLDYRQGQWFVSTPPLPYWLWRHPAPCLFIQRLNSPKREAESWSDRHERRQVAQRGRFFGQQRASASRLK